MLSPRPIRLAAVGAAVVALLLAAWCAWQAWQVQRDLNDAVAGARALQSSLDAGQTARTAAALDAVQTASGRAAERTAGPTWSLLTHVPWFGDDASGVRVTSRVLDDLARDGIAPLVAVVDDLDRLLPDGGAVDVDAVRALQEPVASARAALAAAHEDLQAQDASGYVARLRDQFTDFRDEVARADRAVRAADTAAALLPAMLGGDGDRNYLLVFQNNAEIRATGGLPGAVSEVRAADGTLGITRHVTGASFGRTDQPVLAETKTERQLYQGVLGRYFLDANMTPDFPRAADLMRARWAQEFPDDELAGVLMVDAVTLAYVLDATGPITVDGVTLTGDNAVDELLSGTYQRLEDPRQQDAFFAEVAAAAFERFATGTMNPTGVLRALSRAADERRVYLHSFDVDEQALLAGSAVAGELVTDPGVTAPQVDVTLNDSTGAKMSYYLRYDVDVDATYCAEGVQAFAAKAHLESVAPRDAADLPAYITGGGVYGTEPGRQLVTVRIYAPVDGAISEFELNGKRFEPLYTDENGRPIAMAYIELKPGQRVDLGWRMKGGPGQVDDADLTVTPTIEEQDNAVTVESACR
ncbi:DUF4012 domain-containing protein [Nocardioides sp. GY 10113]|uniref:DUF4012 domain-containing protein n=1 Tax=Nocardioides sp. GY 10113 TaxID=2569761 RepID=UPI0010A7E8DD|nr:DUF4012 domain-containing protein [Nocardioides sp. GY 10113]TIC88381.1 DUF4012 domain-containing protein [Nocardioides sp. GY 10113]